MKHDDPHRNGDFPSDSRPTGRVRRLGFALLAYAFVGIGLLGVLIPGLPTVPFLLLAAWAASRGSRRLHHWLHAHPRFGPPLREWHDEGAVSTGSKAFALSLLAISWMLLLVRGAGPWVVLTASLLFGGVAVFLLTRPVPSPPPPEDDGP